MTARPAARPPARPCTVPRLRPFTPQQKARVSAVIEALLAHWAHACDTLQRSLRAAAESLHTLTRALAPAPRPAARPAWCTPYGPPPRGCRR